MINLKKCNDLINGACEADNIEEHVFLNSYTAAVEGKTLLEYLVSLGSQVDVMDSECLHYLLLGYAWGQYDLDDSLMIEAILDIDDEGSNYH